MGGLQSGDFFTHYSHLASLLAVRLCIGATACVSARHMSLPTVFSPSRHSLSSLLHITLCFPSLTSPSVFSGFLLHFTLASLLRLPKSFLLTSPPSHQSPSDLSPSFYLLTQVTLSPFAPTGPAHRVEAEAGQVQSGTGRGKGKGVGNLVGSPDTRETSISLHYRLPRRLPPGSVLVRLLVHSHFEV